MTCDETGDLMWANTCIPGNVTHNSIDIALQTRLVLDCVFAPQLTEECFNCSRALSKTMIIVMFSSDVTDGGQRCAPLPLAG